MGRDPAAPYITIGVPLDPEAGAEWNNGGESGSRRDTPPLPTTYPGPYRYCSN